MVSKLVYFLINYTHHTNYNEQQRMVKNNVMMLTFVVGCFGLLQISTSSEMNKTYRVQHNFKKETDVFLASNEIISSDVYICKGPGSKRYHYTKSCRGLNSCSTKIYKVSLSEAKELKRTLCGWED